ncbi:MAG: Holliday junction branch migration protein RuvA [Lentisphaeria bacterium]|jgi:Holliday junction DNA helicase RuvA|nr:Holliday junction branch migration protein RuvA [Lentisphaerota bacterium]MBO5643919.1 Holliday junction branch migration protein RuvA [Lentisphaeria bacterium]MBO5992418.1 Holliday junction branch migration protein RuvA [Lentisphaeria bacterium]MBO7153586.1 Holliday junction branch migration protein RuvA [Lentisphaeria bacterium]
MIGSLNGIIDESSFSQCLIDVNGVGYEVEIPLSTFDKLPLPGNRAKLFIHTQVREDAITLFGFSTTEERELFRTLINISGIGGKLALNILGAMPVQNFCAAVSNGDVKALSLINGIGKRTAERIIVELKGKLPETSTGGASLPAMSSANTSDAALALEKLGFKRDAINKALGELVTELAPEEQTTENLTVKALAKLRF